MEHNSEKLTAKDIFNHLSTVVDWNKLNNIKEKMTHKELADKYMGIAREYKKLRDDYINIIKSDPELFADVSLLAKKSFYFDILIDGWSYDANKFNPKDNNNTTPEIPFIPFPFHMDLINKLQYSDKNMHIEKSRRQGGSTIPYLYYWWLMKHHENIDLVITHRDAGVLDGAKAGNDATDPSKNSVLVKFRWWADKSIFIPNDWRDPKWLKNEYSFNTGERILVVNNNRLKGEILTPTTGAGGAITGAILDEIDLVAEKYPGSKDNLTQGIGVAANRLIMVSTYRHVNYPHNKVKLKNDTNSWDFIRLHWSDNPSCNRDWYNEQCSILIYNTTIAKELDINVDAVDENAIFTKYISNENWYNNVHIIENNKIMPQPRYESRFRDFVKVVGADFGGGTSATVFVYGYFDQANKVLYLDDVIKSTSFTAQGILDEFVMRGYQKIKIAGDISGKNQTTVRDSSWFKILNGVGLRVKGISNRLPKDKLKSVLEGISENKIIINTNSDVLRDDITYASFLNDKIRKNEFSHTIDAIIYLWFYLTNKKTTYFGGIHGFKR